MRPRAVEFKDGALMLLDQRALPGRTAYVTCRTWEAVAEAIRTLTVRGAPAIGLAGAYGAVLAAQTRAEHAAAGDEFTRMLLTDMQELERARPTAVNLSWAVGRMRRAVVDYSRSSPIEVVEQLLAEANRIYAEDQAANESMAEYGQELIADGARILTHCNTGALVASSLGTALGVVTTAHDRGKQVHIWVDETRPLLQGARLTTWELQEAGVPYTLITDNMAAHFMARGEIDLVILGADRIAANGDTANKIGTYGVAVLAHAHGIPFYVAAPTSTVDLSVASGSLIPIEERNPDEVSSFGGIPVAPAQARVANPAFDVTPARLITAIVTEIGIVRPPFVESLRRAIPVEAGAATVS